MKTTLFISVIALALCVTSLTFVQDVSADKSIEKIETETRETFRKMYAEKTREKMRRITLGQSPEDYLKRVLGAHGATYSEEATNRLCRNVFAIAQIKPKFEIGSGFRLTDNVIITNQHVVVDESRGNMLSALLIQDMHGNEIHVDEKKIVLVPEEHIALIFTEEPTEDHLLMSSKSGDIGEIVFHIGLGSSEFEIIERSGRFKPFFTVSQGRIEALVGKAGNKDCDRPFQKNDYLRLSIFANHGDSGGPILDDEGNVLGIIFAGTQATKNARKKGILWIRTSYGEKKGDIIDAIGKYAPAEQLEYAEMSETDITENIVSLDNLKEKFSQEGITIFFFFELMTKYPQAVDQLNQLCANHSDLLYNRGKKIIALVICNKTLAPEEDDGKRTIFLNGDETLDEWIGYLEKINK